MNEETLFLAGLMKYPALMFGCNDLELYHFSHKDLFCIYKLILESDYDKIRNGGYVYIYTLTKGKVTNMTRKSILEWGTMFLETELNPENILNTYKVIKKNWIEKRYNSLINNIHTENNSFDEKIEKVYELVEQIRNDSLDKIKMKNLEDIKYIEQNPDLKTGIRDIDNFSCLKNNHLIILAARPFSGKTTFACKLAMENSNKGKIIFISMEMNKESIADKMKEYGPFYKRENIFIIERSSIDLAMITKIIVQQKPALLIIDQLNKINYPANSEYEKFTKVCRSLKELTMKFYTPIICLAQVSRQGEGNMPTYKDLKGSGSVEEEADFVFFLNVTDRNNYLTQIQMSKNRSKKGRLINKTLKFNPDTNFYYEQ